MTHEETCILESMLSSLDKFYLTSDAPRSPNFLPTYKLEELFELLGHANELV